MSYLLCYGLLPIGEWPALDWQDWQGVGFSSVSPVPPGKWSCCPSMPTRSRHAGNLNVNNICTLVQGHGNLNHTCTLVQVQMVNAVFVRKADHYRILAIAHGLSSL